MYSCEYRQHFVVVLMGRQRQQPVWMQLQATCRESQIRERPHCSLH